MAAETRKGGLTLLHCLNRIRLSIRNFDGELLRGNVIFRECWKVQKYMKSDLFYRHDNLDCVQAVQTQVICERGRTFEL